MDGMQHFDKYLINPKVFTEALVLSRRLWQQIYCLTVNCLWLNLIVVHHPENLLEKNGQLYTFHYFVISLFIYVFISLFVSLFILLFNLFVKFIWLSNSHGGCRQLTELRTQIQKPVKPQPYGGSKWVGKITWCAPYSSPCHSQNHVIRAFLKNIKVDNSLIFSEMMEGTTTENCTLFLVSLDGLS